MDSSLRGLLAEHRPWSTPGPSGPCLTLISYRHLGPQDAPAIESLLFAVREEKNIVLLPRLVREGCSTITLTLTVKAPEIAGILIANLLQTVLFQRTASKTFDVAVSAEPYARLNLRTGEIDGLSGGHRVRAFISYAKEDAVHKNALQQHLQGLVRTGALDAWDDTAIQAGEIWEDTIREQLERAQIFIPLVSRAFMSSDYCVDKELRLATEKKDRGELLFVPTLVRPVDLVPTPFARMQVVPAGPKAVTEFENADTAWAEVARSIRHCCERMRERRLALRSPKASEK